MVVRIISGAIVLAFLLVFGLLGGPAQAIFLGVLSCIGYLEFTKATNVRLDEQKVSGYEKVGFVTIILYYILLILFDDVMPFHQILNEWAVKEIGMFNYFTILILLLFIIAVVIMFGIYIFTYPKHKIQQMTPAVFGMIYVALTLSFAYHVRELPHGIYLVWLVYISASVCDTFAYFSGCLFGKHKLTPKLSPKKTIEGAVGGCLAATIAGGLMGWIYYAFVDNRIGVIPLFALVCFIGSIVSMCGDLTASAVKRDGGIKDYGKLIPGHGGVLDRFDSVIFTAPMVYFLVVLFLHFD
ncbi:MAG: phosphatidate cytidylyltransferase [Lachnospiraceae bacterium]|nr:phosphatidate cytidylyltransferase [Lachnospiraceae bacterium]